MKENLRIVSLLLLLGSAAPLAAQNEPPPLDTPPAAESAAPASFVERTLKSGNKTAGFSVDLRESYVPNFTTTQTGPQGVSAENTSFTSVSPRLFLGSRGTRYQLLFDYSFGYRSYHRANVPGSSTQTGAIGYRLQASPNVVLSLENALSSGVNDQGLPLGSSLSFAVTSAFEQPIYVPRQRTTSDQLRANLDYRVAKRTNLNFLGGFSFWRYHNSPDGDTRTGEVGIRVSHQVNKWFFFENAFSQYLAGGETAARRTNVQKLQVGEIRLVSLKKLELGVGGGLESASYQGVRRNTGSGTVTLKKESEKTRFALTYHRGFSLAVGPDALLDGNNASASVTRWFGRKVTLRVASMYTTGHAFDGSKLKSASGNADLEFALSRHFLMSGQYTYVSQKGTGSSIAVPTITRSTVSAGIQYFVTALSER